MEEHSMIVIINVGDSITGNFVIEYNQVHYNIGFSSQTEPLWYKIGYPPFNYIVGYDCETRVKHMQAYL